MESIWSNYVILGENGPNWIILGVNRSIFWAGTKIFFLKTVSKAILVRFINITLIKNVINGFNFMKIGNFKSK